MLARQASRSVLGRRGLAAVTLSAHSTTEGVDYSVNWALAKSGVIPPGQAFRDAQATLAHAGTQIASSCVLM